MKPSEIRDRASRIALIGFGVLGIIGILEEGWTFFNTAFLVFGAVSIFFEVVNAVCNRKIEVPFLVLVIFLGLSILYLGFCRFIEFDPTKFLDLYLLSIVLGIVASIFLRKT